jgi:hypothetical protein
MKHAKNETGRILASLACLLVSSTALGAGCTAASSSEDLGVSEAAVTVPVTGDPRVSVGCVGGVSFERHNSAWPGHADGLCGADEYTIDSAVADCGGGPLKYFLYSCGNSTDGTHAYTAYAGCCMPAPVGAACTKSTQCASGRCGVGISFETRYNAPGGPFPQSPAEAIALFDSLPQHDPLHPGYGYDALSSTAVFYNLMNDPLRDNTAFGSHLRASIIVTGNQVGEWQFRLGPDYGKGGTLLVDGVPLASRWLPPDSLDGVQGLHWGGDWSRVNDILVGAVKLGPGSHEIEAYGFENCCDGAMALEMRVPGGAVWQPISPDTVPLDRYCVPAPQ